VSNKEIDTVLGLNAETVKTKKGDVVVRELTIEDIGVISGQLIELFSKIPVESLADKSNLKLVVHLVAQGNLVESLKAVLAQVTEKESEFYRKFSMIDFGKVVLAFLRVNDVKELKQLFFDLRALVQNPVPEKK